MLLLSLLLLLPQQPGLADISCGGQALTPADALLQTAQAGVIRCSDGAVVKYEDLRVESNWMEYNLKTMVLTAGDRVQFTQGEERLSGGRLSYNVETKTGTFTDVSGEIEGFYVEAGDYERLPNGDWQLSRISTTACEGDCPRWKFTFKEATITPGERVSGKNVVFRFFNVPLFYFPSFTVPTGTRERSSGFLIPSTSTSTTKGRSIRESFYWAINRSYDAILTGEYFSERGPAGNIEFRGVPNPSTSINVNTLFAIDNSPAEQGGYRTNILAYSGLGRGWRGVAKINVTSDFEFRQVYEDGFSAISSPVQQSIAFATRNSPRSSLNFLYDRSAIFYPGEPSTMLRKFPAVDFQVPMNRLGFRMPVYFSLDAGLSGMARRDSQIDTPALMQRVDVRPSIEIPLVRSSPFTWSHQFGVRETLYTHSLNSDVHRETLNRGIFDYSTKITGPQFEKDFGSWRHVVEPTIEYRYVTGVDEFSRTIIVDENDLITDTNEIEYGITNHFMAGHEFLSWRIAQKLYFDPTFGEALVAGRRNTLHPLMDLTGFAFSDGEPRRFSPIVSTFRIATTRQTSTDIQVDYDTQREEFRAAGVMGNLQRGLIGSSIGYFFNRGTEIQFSRNQLSAQVTFGSQTRRGLNAGFSMYYDFRQSLFQGSTGQLSYNSECYGLSFEFAQVNLGFRRESRLRFSLTLKNIGSFGTLPSPERLF